MARKAVYFRARISTLERKIAWYKYRECYNEETALRFLAIDMGVKLDEAAIVDYVNEYVRYAARGK